MKIRIVRSQWVVSEEEMQEAARTLGLQAATIHTVHDRFVLEFDPNLELLAEVLPSNMGNHSIDTDGQAVKWGERRGAKPE